MGRTDTDAYKAYVDEVFAAGFNQNYDRGDKLFKADNMDGYETFMNHYVELGKKAQANPSDTTLLSECTALLQEELDWSAKIDAVVTNSLSAADAAYYLAVTGRVVAKLSELQPLAHRTCLIVVHSQNAKCFRKKGHLQPSDLPGLRSLETA